MNENNYNVCSRCGSANPLSARYCYQCGFELKNPEAPVVCTKCNTVNAGSANFCKRCGSKLPKAQSKTICPKCSAANNSQSTYCVNCGYDFTTQTMPSSAAVQQAQQAQVAATDVVITQQPKLTRREKARLKREEEERAYRAEVEAKKAARLQKKQLKQAAKQPAAQPPVAVQPQYVQPPVYAAQPMIAAAEPKPRSKRLKNLLAMAVALVGLYFILLPEQANFLKISFPLAGLAAEGATVPLTGWDIIIACLSNFVGSAANLSSVVAANVGMFNSFEIILAGVALAVIAISLVNYFFAKFVGVCSGKGHRGVDAFAVCMTVITLAATLCLNLMEGFAAAWSWNMAVVPGVYLALALLNSNKRND